MIRDITTVVKKEWNEYIHARGSRRGMIFTVLFPIVLFGVFFPLMAGREWVESPVTLISFAWIPLLFVSALTADSFAGERERHTLETLLASRLSDRAILIGKFVSAVSYGLAMTALIVLAGLVTVNITQWQGELLLFPLKGSLIGVVLVVLLGCFISSAGILVSLRASTVRQAHQTLALGVIIVAFSPTIVIKFMPREMRQSIFGELNTIDPSVAVTVILAVLLVLNTLLLAAALARFKRARMILD